jgi:acylpyruvate hydrolase
MRLSTIRLAAGGTAAVRVDGEVGTEIGFCDVGELLARPDWRTVAAEAAGARHDLADADYATLISKPDKVLCVGLNYRSHILEMGRQLPRYPTLVNKFAGALIGAHDDIVLPAASDSVDWEAELAVVVGQPGRHLTEATAAECIAGYTVTNDVTVRDWQYRSAQWLQGKTFESTTPVGPVLVTSDDSDIDPTGMDIECEVDGELVQKSNTHDLVFGPAALVAYVSTILTVLPGDIISTGTPSGIGHAHRPARYLTAGTVLVTRISGLGEARNSCRPE